MMNFLLVQAVWNRGLLSLLPSWHRWLLIYTPSRFQKELIAPWAHLTKIWAAWFLILIPGRILLYSGDFQADESNFILSSNFKGKNNQWDSWRGKEDSFALEIASQSQPENFLGLSQKWRLFLKWRGQEDTPRTAACDKPSACYHSPLQWLGLAGLFAHLVSFPLSSTLCPLCIPDLGKLVRWNKLQKCSVECRKK